jgi:hypothetical protein
MKEIPSGVQWGTHVLGAPHLPCCAGSFVGCRNDDTIRGGDGDIALVERTFKGFPWSSKYSKRGSYIPVQLCS